MIIAPPPSFNIKNLFKRKQKPPIAVILASAAVVAAILTLVLLTRKTASDLTVMNTNKSVYSPNETVVINLSTTNLEINNICRGNLKIKVSGPDNFKIMFSTKKGTIVNTPTCAESNNKTNNPDYQASFVPQKEGVYTIKLTNLNTKTKVTKTIKVENEMKMKFEREGTTRVNPSQTEQCSMILRITSENDFKGWVMDFLPSPTQVIWKGEAKVESGKITWNVDLKAGETKELSYAYIVPAGGVQTISFGPAQALTEGQKAFEETSSWQVIVGRPLEPQNQQESLFSSPLPGAKPTKNNESENNEL